MATSDEYTYTGTGWLAMYLDSPEGRDGMSVRAQIRKLEVERSEMRELDYRQGVFNAEHEIAALRSRLAEL